MCVCGGCVCAVVVCMLCVCKESSFVVVVVCLF